MSNILILTNKYSGNSSANGICARNIVNELKKVGHKTYILCYENQCIEDNVYSISNKKNKNNNRIVSIFSFIKSFFVKTIDKKKSLEYQEYTLRMIDEKQIDAVICFFFPLETITVLKSIKNNFPRVKTFIYELDSIGDGIFASYKIRYLAIKNYERWASQYYYYADNVFIMKSHEKYWRRVWGKKYENKLIVSDIPVLLNIIEYDSLKINKQKFSMIYTGELNKKYRSPIYFLKFIDEISMKYNVSVKFYTKGNCENIIKHKTQKSNCIKQCGYVTKDVLDNEIYNSDILISIGNNKSNSVPSKLITYMSYGKPIIHFSKQNNDICETYLNKYKYGLVLSEKMSIRYNLEKFRVFFNNLNNYNIDCSEIIKILEMNTPQYSVNLMNKFIEQ